jgi:Zn-dependent peptidase ImmA (M78 family)
MIEYHCGFIQVLAMSKPARIRLWEQRRLLENPYAYIEQFEADRDEHAREAQCSPIDGSIYDSRKLLENPYAYLDDNGRLSANIGRLTAPFAQSPPHERKAETGRGLPHGAKAPISYSDGEIEGKARELHELIWRQRTFIWGDKTPTDPIDMLDPAAALALIGYDFDLKESLGQYRAPSGLIEVAGQIDRESRTVRVSRQFPANVRTFTAAHELGHAVLHPSFGGVHRDRPLSGVGLSREMSEIQADKFATFFLMPAKLVRSTFMQMFQVVPFPLSEETSFALSGSSLSDLRRKYRSRRDLSKLLASTERYDGKHFRSLAARFRVSVEAMAIRIEELELLAA